MALEWPRGIQGCHELSSAAGREVRIAHRHLDGGVPEPLLNLTKRRPRHYELTREGMPAVVPSDLPETCPAACSPEAFVKLVDAHRLAVGVAEDAWSPNVFQLPKSRFELRRHRDLAILAALRGPYDARRRRTADDDLLVRPIVGAGSSGVSGDITNMKPINTSLFEGGA